MSSCTDSVRLQSNSIHLVTGASGIGKSTLIRQVEDSFTIIKDDHQPSSELRRLLVEATWLGKPVILEKTVNIKSVLVWPEFDVTIYVVLESLDTITERRRQRSTSGNVVEATAEKAAAPYESVARNNICHVGSSDEIRDRLKLAASNKPFYSYAIIENSSNNVIYVGKGKSTYKSDGHGRIYTHKLALRSVLNGKRVRYSKAMYQYMATRILAGDSFRFHIVDFCDSEVEAFESEANLQVKYSDTKLLFNSVRGGFLGYATGHRLPRRKISAETSAKISAAREGYTFDRPYISAGCYTLTDDECMFIEDNRDGIKLELDKKGRVVNLTDEEYASVRLRRHRLKYKFDTTYKQKVTDYHKVKIEARRREKAEEMGLDPQNLPKRITHLSHLSDQQIKELRNRLSVTRYHLKVARIECDAVKIGQLENDILVLKASFGIKRAVTHGVSGGIDLTNLSGSVHCESQGS